MAVAGNISAKPADRLFHTAKWSPLLSGLLVIIAAILWTPRKTASFFVYINTLTPVLTIPTAKKGE